MNMRLSRDCANGTVRTSRSFATVKVDGSSFASGVRTSCCAWVTCCSERQNEDRSGYTPLHARDGGSVDVRCAHSDRGERASHVACVHARRGVRCLLRRKRRTMDASASPRLTRAERVRTLHGIYAIVNEGPDAVSLVQACVEAGVRVVQYRAKRAIVPDHLHRIRALTHA